MVRRCADEALEEADDLDWKGALPNSHNPQTPGEFAKDVAAMANTRGGLIIYGVSDKPIEFKGIRKEDANADQYAQWVRNLVQPYIAGLDLYCLASEDGRETALVVDVPASELAPHSVAFDQTSDRAKSQFATVTPYRDGPHTAWMAEHQIARAYADRFTRGSQWEAEFNELQTWLSEMLASRSDAKHAWLLTVTRPTRPVPRTAPRLTADAAQAVIDDACDHPVNINNAVFVLRSLASRLGYVNIGLNCWIITNRSFGRPPSREVYVELHHDGSVVLAVNAGERTLRPPADQPIGSVINSDVIEQACADLETLILAATRARRIDSPIRLRMSVVSDPAFPVQCATRDFGSYVISSAAPELVRVRPVAAELPAGAAEDSTKAVSAQLAAGILNQFGLACQLSRYRSL